MKRLRIAVGIVLMLVSTQGAARADVILDWNAIAVNTLIAQAQSPFAQARYMAITQLAVFEAVNAITGDYEPYLGTVVAPAGASAEAAAIAAAYGVLNTYFPGAAGLLGSYNASLAAIPDGQAKTDGIATGQTAALLMTNSRLNDGSAPPAIDVPASTDPGVWQLTPSCTAGGGVNFQWQFITPFSVPSTPGSQAWMNRFFLGPPPALTSNKYAKDYNEVSRVGDVTSDSTERPLDRANVARIYAAASPAYVFNSVARQLATAQHDSLSENARSLALINMSSSDSLVMSFAVKYFYNLWRPETAIKGGNLDDNSKTDADLAWAPYIGTPCFPSYPSNHASGSNGASEVLRRLYGAGGHSITMSHPSVPGVVLSYKKLKQITDDIDDARVYGGIHFRFDQDAGSRLGREIATYTVKHNLRRVKGQGHGHNAEDEDENED